MPRVLFNRMCDKLIGKWIFLQRRDAIWKQDINPRMLYSIMTCLSIRFMLESGRWDLRNVCIINSINLFNFIESIVNEFGEDYLRSLTDDDLRRILQIIAIRGFLGCIGSCDCQHYQCKNFLLASSGQPAILSIKARKRSQLLCWKPFLMVSYGYGDVMSVVLVVLMI